MNGTQFQQVVTKRAAERMQKRVKECKVEVLTAIRKLYGESDYHCATSYALTRTNIKAALLVLASDDPSKGWPTELWREEEKQVSAELFKVMDEMQKALLAPEPDTTSEDYAHPAEDEEGDEAK